MSLILPEKLRHLHEMSPLKGINFSLLSRSLKPAAKTFGQGYRQKIISYCSLSAGSKKKFLSLDRRFPDLACDRSRGEAGGSAERKVSRAAAGIMRMANGKFSSGQAQAWLPFMFAILDVCFKMSLGDASIDQLRHLQVSGLI